MKRDARLIPLSREHHAALVLARRIDRASDDAQRRELCQQAAEHFETQLARHFDVEEAQILPVLAAAHPDLVERTLAEHRRMRELVRQVASIDHGALREFGSLLSAHTRFEDRQLFPLFEAMFDVAAGGMDSASLSPLDASTTTEGTMT